MTSGASHFRISGIGAAVPDEILTNNDLKKYMDTSDEWITERTGIKERRIGGTTSGLGVAAAKVALERAALDPSDVEQIILATTTPEQQCPGTAPRIAKELGCTCGAFDVQAACAGWVYGFVTATGLISQGTNNVLLIGSETLDKITDFSDRGTGILFGNGAGAAVIEAAPRGGELLAFDLASDGSLGDILYADHNDVFKMAGREVFKHAVVAIEHSITKVCEDAGVKPADVDLVVPHQANVRIIDLAWRRLGISMDNTALILSETGNTSAASIPMALNSAFEQNRLAPDKLVLLVGFGAGMTWASALIRWA